MILRARRPANVLPALALLAIVVAPGLAVGLTTVDGRSSLAAPPPDQPLPALAEAATPAPSQGPPQDTSRPPAQLAPDGPTSSREPVAGAFSVLIPGSVNRTSVNLSAEYDVALSLNFDTRTFKVASTMTVRNDSGSGIDRLELNTIAARLGGLKLTGVTVAGTPVKATIDDQTIVVPFGGILGRGASLEVTVAYAATLRSSLSGSNWLFTRTNGIVDAYRWVPWISRNVPFDRPNHGDPFITPVSPRIRVAITSNRSLVYATTGERVSTSGLRQTFEATNVRDFVFSAAPDYKTTSATVGDTTIRVYYRSGAPATSILTAAKHAISKMEPLVGAYPYTTYRLAQSAGGYGMEAPGLTWIPTGVGTANLSYLVHHETAHQWFYGIVGSDQAREPFTDEAATDFLARYVLGLRRAARCSTARLDLSIYKYSSACYYEIVYIQGGNFIDDVRKRIGSTAFWAGLRAYIAENRFKLAATKTLLDTLDEHTSVNLVPRFEPRFPRLY
jgi:hypothetical protein